MLEIRRKRIKNCVFRKTDIQALSSAIADEFQKTTQSVALKKESFHGNMSFLVSCDDDTSYRSETPDLFQDGRIIDIKRIKSISMQSICFAPNRSITLSVSPIQFECLNTITVEGSDRDWVAGAFTRLTETMSAVPPQNKSPRRLTNILFIPAAVGYAFLILFILHFVLACATPFVWDTKMSVDQILGTYSLLLAKRWPSFLIIFFPCLMLALFTKDWVLALWPEIEFDFGPEHMNKEKQRRTRIVSLYSVVFVPLLLTAFYEITRAIVLR